MDDKKITLNKEKETLLIPLYGKAIESRKKVPILIDKKANEIVSKINYDFKSLKIPAKTNTMMCLRAKLIDNFVIKHIKKNEKHTVLHIGCGLDSRYVRINNSEVDWYDLDYKEVIEIRRNFFPETAKYHLIGSSVTDLDWIKKIPVGENQNLVIAEGLFMYLKNEEIKSLLKALKEHLGLYTLVFDAFNVYTARKVNKHPSIKKTGAIIHWDIDDSNELSNWDPDIRFIKEIFLTSNEEIKRMGFGLKLAYRVADLFPIARKAQRILIYEVVK